MQEEAPPPPKKAANRKLLGEEDYAFPKSVSLMPIQSTGADDTTPLVAARWLKDGDITTWLTSKLYHLWWMTPSFCPYSTR